MSTISYDLSSGEFLANRAAWVREIAGDNDERLRRMRRNLRLAREEVLTPRQREVVALYFDQGMTIGQIAMHLGVNRSTVSRTLGRAKRRLFISLRYSL